MKKYLRYLPVGLLGLAGIIAARTMKSSRPKTPLQPLDDLPIDPTPVAEHLSGLIQCQTISGDEGQQVEEDTFRELHSRLENYYPRVKTCLKREYVNHLSLLYSWEGTQPELPALLLAAHQDVVPAANSQDWIHPPFAGTIANGFVWGRGALDIKNQLVTTLEAVEYLLSVGYQPKRTIFLAYGHDEEIGGIQGANRIVEELHQRGIQLGAVIDEGGSIMEGALPGVKIPVAMIGTGEKGYLTLQLKVESQPGHSSTPPKYTAIGILGRALGRLEARKFPPDINMILPMLHILRNSLSLKMRILAENPWLFKPWLIQILDTNPRTSATIRTTTAPTMISSGSKENILPGQATAVVNFRLKPGDSLQGVVGMVKERIRDERVQIILPEPGGWEATTLSPVDSPFYASLERLIQQSFGNPPVTPYLMLGGADARHYARMCPNVYRFSPLRVNMEDRKGVHGNNERIGVNDLEKMVQFFVQLIRLWDNPDVESNGLR